MSKKLIVIATLVCVAIMLVFGTLFAADSTKTTPPAKTETAAPGKTEAKAEKAATAKFDFIGDKKCKLCHKNEHDSWATTVHAKAWEALKPEEQKKDSCTVCHSTGKDATGALLTGVQCEACHGAGSAYKTSPIMKDIKQATANGLKMATKEVCVTCHNEKSPTFKGFDFDKYVKNEKGMHKHFPKKTEVKKG